MIQEKKLYYYAACLGYYTVTGELPELSIQGVQEVFTKIMADGVYCDEFVDIFYPSSEYIVDFVTPLKNVLEKLGITIPTTYRDAVYGILRYHLSNILEGIAPPIGGIMAINRDLDWYLACMYRDDPEFKHTTGQFCYYTRQDLSTITCEVGDLVLFCDRYWGYSAPPHELSIENYKNYEGEKALALLEKDILLTARRWLNYHK